jgi:hypothetical protein
MTPRLGLLVFTAALLSVPSAARAAPVVHTAVLTGPSESPPNSSPGTGTATVTIDVVAHTLRVQATFSNLVAPTTAAHIHSPTTVPGGGVAAVAVHPPYLLGFPIGVTSGTYDQTFNTLLAATYDPAFLTASGGTPAAAEAALAASLRAGTAYFNIHSTTYPAGEIRGFLVQASGEGSFAGAAAPTAVGGEGSFGFGGARNATAEPNRPARLARAVPGPGATDADAALVCNVSHRQTAAEQGMAEGPESAVPAWTLAVALGLTALSVLVMKLRG